jgi:hypothetical protein
MLFRFVLKLGLGIALVAAFGVALIRAQQVDESLLEDFLRQGCETVVGVCWHGIRPGITRIDDAAALLEAHPWVDDVFVRRQPLLEYISWTWNEKRPAFLDSSGERVPPFIWARAEIIDHITIPTLLSYGEALRTLGRPEQGAFLVLRARRNTRFPTLATVWHMAGYENGLYLIYMTASCPVSAQRMWGTPVTISIYSTARVALESYDFDHWLYREKCRI